MAIAYRIKLLSKERDEAILGEVLARRLADIDPLTGLLNRRAFLEKAIGRTGEHVLQIADIDHFKRVNDTLGHDGGDEVLRVFARLLRGASPAGALIARIGGEEFAILTASDEAIGADQLLARLALDADAVRHQGHREHRQLRGADRQRARLEIALSRCRSGAVRRQIGRARPCARRGAKGGLIGLPSPWPGPMLPGRRTGWTGAGYGR
ncbi:MAG: GGDEF domain-containing protein [Sphingomonas sp.]